MCFPDARQFVDDMAQVNDDLEGSDDSYSDGEVERWEEENLNGMRVLRDYKTAANFIKDTSRSAVSFHRKDSEFDLAIEFEEAEQMVEYIRCKDQLTRPKEDLSGAEVGGCSFSATLNVLPDINDFDMFGVSCQVRRMFLFFTSRYSYSP